MKNISKSLFVMIAMLAISGSAFAAKTGTLDAPAVTVGGATQASLAVTVTAGASGAPAGFSLQWMTRAAYEANGNQWFLSDDPSLCKASFSGNAYDSRYPLGANQSITVTVGDILIDNGASTSCDASLACGTEYVFRAFAHATGSKFRSDFSANATGATLACGHADEGCTLTQGYWKNHVENWPVAGLLLGSYYYNVDELLAILRTSPGTGRSSNGLIMVSHQLIAAKLNVANGASDAAIADTIAATDLAIGSLIVPPVGAGYLAPSAVSGLNETLTSYNEGTIGPGHCD